MDITEYLTESNIIIMQTGATKDDLLKSLLDLLSQSGHILDPKKAMAEILEREDVMSTGIGLGLAFPHIKSEAVKKMGMAMAICKTPVLNFESLDGQPVYFVILIATPAGEHRRYLEALAKTSQLLKSEKLRNSLQQASSSGEAYTWIQVSQ